MENQLLRRPAACKGGNLIQCLLPAHKVALSLFHLHGISQCPRCPGYNGNLLNRGAVALAGSHQRMAHLMVRHDSALLLGNNRIFLLVSGNNRLHAFLQVGLHHGAAAHTHCPQGCLVDDIGQLRAAGACRGPGNGIVIHIFRHLHVLSVNL